MNATILDLETHGQASALAAPYPKDDRTPPANYKNAEAIAGWYERDEKDWRTQRAKECALSPRLGRIVAVGVEEASVNARIVRVELGEPNEGELIRYALEHAHDAIRKGLLVTFNGLTFDLPFLHVRAAILGVAIPYQPGVVLRRYVTQPHADLRAVLTNWDHKTTGTLHEWAHAFGIPVTDETSGADIGAMVEQGDVDGIRAHCASDLQLTAMLAERMAAANLISL